MYTGCNGETCIYTCCIDIRACICGKIHFLALGTAKRDKFQVCIGKWKRPSESELSCMG
jgi:hypothetical protein